MPISVQAASGTEKMGSISLKYEKGSTTFSFFRVAEFSEKGNFKLEDDFSKYQVTFDDLDTDEWRKLAETFSGYVLRDKIASVHQEKTNAEGVCRWENVEKGLYLVMGESSKDEKYTYTPMPFLITVPNRNAKEEWNLQVTADIKYEREERLEASRKVIKVWKDDKNKSSRPKEIAVELLRDGKVYQTVKLNEKNNWRHTWDSLPLGYSWKVVEKDVPKGYTVTSSREGDVFIVTNTYKTEKKQPKPLNKTTEEKDEKLIQAGVLWWPVPILAIGGVAAFFAGWVKRREYEEFHGES